MDWLAQQLSRDALTIEGRFDLQLMCYRDGGHNYVYLPECANDRCRKCGAWGD